MIKQNLLLYFCMTCIFILFAGPSYSQQGQLTIRGTVKAADGSPIDGASVVVTRTKQGTSTDVDGNFEFEVPSGTTGTLTITHAAF